MLELLPNTQKKALKKEYFLRFSVVFLLFLFVAGILFFIFLLPSYFLSTEKEKIVNKEFENRKKSNVDLDDEGFRLDIKNSKEMIALLLPANNEHSIKDLIAKIISKKNHGIVIDGLSMNYSKNGQHQIFIRGMSKNREFLKLFAESLRAENEFINVDLPISNFAKISDIDFNITLKTAI